MIAWRHRRLGYGLGLSLAAHALWLASGEPVAPPRLHFAAQTPSFAVALQAHTEKPRPSPPKTTPARSEPVKVPSPPSHPARIPQPRKPVAKAAPPPATPPRPAARPPMPERAHIVQRLRRDLRAHFTYPPLARRRNIEGRVRLGLEIDPRGTIRNVRVITSSGHAILDRAAERALHRLHRVEWYPAMAGERTIAIELPIVYRLTNRRGI